MNFIKEIFAQACKNREPLFILYKTAVMDIMGLMCN